MKLLTTTLLTLISSTTAAANQWTLYCGSTCANGTAIISGSEYQGASCTNLVDLPYNSCYFESDVAWYYAVVFEHDGCVVSSDGPETVISSGECTSAGALGSYEVMVNL